MSGPPDPSAQRGPDDATRTRTPEAASPPEDATRSRAPDEPVNGAQAGALGTGAGWSPPVPPRVGRFEIRRQIGEGAFGRVYEAHDPALGRVIALKVAKPEALTGPARVA